MYEPIRTKSVPTVAATPADFPHRTREEELDIQLAGHLSALLAVTDALRARAPDHALDAAARRLSLQVARLTAAIGSTAAPGHEATLGDGAGQDPAERIAALHRRAHALAGRALVVAASRADTAAAILAAECMDAHAAGAASKPGGSGGPAGEPAGPKVAASL